jgi:hypothetical protein
MSLLIMILPFLAETCDVRARNSEIPLYSGDQVRSQRFQLEVGASCGDVSGEVLLEAYTLDGTIQVSGEVKKRNDVYWLEIADPIAHQDVVSSWGLSKINEPKFAELNLGLYEVELEPILAHEILGAPPALQKALSDQSPVAIAANADAYAGQVATRVSVPLPAHVVRHKWETSVPGVTLQVLTKDGKSFAPVEEAQPDSFYVLGPAISNSAIVGVFTGTSADHEIEVRVELASGAEQVSVPIPRLAPLFEVACPRRGVKAELWEARTGDVLDIDDVTIEGNLCTIRLNVAQAHQMIYDINSISHREGTSQGKVTEARCSDASPRVKQKGTCISQPTWEPTQITEDMLSKLTPSDLDRKCTIDYPDQLGRVCVYSHKDALRASRLLAYYGDQEFVIVVSEVRESEVGKVWRSQPVTLALDTVVWEQEIKFPTYTNDVNVLYEVRLEPVGAESAEPVEDVVARLRPRGRFGIASKRLGSFGVRVYLTIPVNVLGLRARASGIDLENSQANPNVQLAMLETGLLFVVEPWSYLRARNWSPVPFYFAGGLTFSTLDVDKGIVDPHLLLGGGLSLPVVSGASQLDTSLTLGLYWNVDLRRSHPFTEGNHALVMLGTNAFSLFGAQSAKKK